jgi:hypothetical protein
MSDNFPIYLFPNTHGEMSTLPLAAWENIDICYRMFRKIYATFTWACEKRTFSPAFFLDA